MSKDAETQARIDGAVEMYARNTLDEVHLRRLFDVVYASGVFDGTRDVVAVMTGAIEKAAATP